MCCASTACQVDAVACGKLELTAALEAAMEFFIMRVDCVSWKSFLFILALCLITASTASAQVAEVYIGSEKVIFEVFAENDGLILSFAGPCGVITKHYEAGDTPVIYINDDNGEILMDGSYTWELKTRPKVDPEIRELLQQARKNGNDAEVAKFLFKEGKLPTDISQFGYVTVFEKNFVKLEEEEPNRPAPTVRDFVILDDLIVDGSACIGFDCVNGESFGFDTIRLKENNLRIKFDDTSIAASFPRTDWQLTANSSANGGASKFSIDDISGSRTPFTVEANAPSHSLYVDDGGRVGIRTSTPSTEIHVIDGDTPTLRLQQDGSSGFGPQTWDVAGNETNFFIRDVSNGSTLPFRIRPSAPTSSIDIATDGDVGIGTASPDGRLHVVGNSTNLPEIFLESTAGAAANWRIQNNATSGRLTFTDDSTGVRVPFKFDPGADNNLLRIGVAGADTVDITGTLDITGEVVVDGMVVHPDYVFEPGYDLDTVEEHAAKMWANGHLPALPPAPEGGTGPIKLVSHQMGMLEELEKAHIYIEQLHTSMKEMKAANEELVERLLALEKKVSE